MAEREHQENENGEWSCSALNKQVKVTTVSKGVKACGHCLKPILDREGNKQPWSIVDQFKARGWIKAER